MARSYSSLIPRSNEQPGYEVRGYSYQCPLHQDAVSVDQLVGTLRQDAASTDVGNLWRLMDRVVFIDSTWQQTHGILKVSYNSPYMRYKKFCFMLKAGVCLTLMSQGGNGGT